MIFQIFHADISRSKTNQLDLLGMYVSWFKITKMTSGHQITYIGNLCRKICQAVVGSSSSCQAVAMSCSSVMPEGEKYWGCQYIVLGEDNLPSLIEIR